MGGCFQTRGILRVRVCWFHLSSRHPFLFVMHFDIIDLRLVVHIAEARSMTKGAELSFISLPAASTRIKNLEDRVGTRLFYRTSAGATVTPAGQAFEQHARAVLGQIQRLNGDMQEFARGIKGLVRLFAVPSAINERLPNVLRNYLIANPDVNIDLREHLSYDTVRALEEGQTDIGIVAGPVVTANLLTMPYAEDHLVLVVPKRHPLSQLHQVRFSDTLDFDYIGLPESSAFSVFIRQICHDLHRTMKVRIKVGNFESSCRMIEAGVGIGILPESTAKRHISTIGVSIVPLADVWATRKLMICVRSLDDLPKFTRDLVDLLIQDAQSAV